ncbi:ABC transporter ATP-binding protein [Benzoatithermus flavus]|uniref:ABC transporter ATP-binding protein n=1 Tax=Benzoatithermus flavus TaxID=3108223 RepID=A0ABU8XZE3_9PROT
MTVPILATRSLAKRFGGVVATDRVDLAVAEGELRCIIGPNGAGKSTLFALLCGIYRPDAGTIRLKGKDVTTLPAFRRVRLGLGLTFQTNRAYHDLSVRQNLETPLRIARADAPKDAEERFRYALELFGLDPGSELPARELPHHRLQWLEIAMVLAAGPDILLLDEPTAGMSPEETMQTARVLQHLNRAGLTIVVVEHDIAFVREVAQSVTVLHQGRVFAEGSVADITAHEDVRKIYLGRA